MSRSEHFTAMEIAEGFAETSDWLNTLEILFNDVRRCTVAAAEAHTSESMDALLVSVDAFNAEFYGVNAAGEEDPDAPPSDVELPAHIGEKVQALIDGAAVQHIHADTVAIVLQVPPQGSQLNTERAEQIMQRAAASMRAAWPDPKPLIVVNPGAPMDMTTLDLKAMEAHGWVRKIDG